MMVSGNSAKSMEKVPIFLQMGIVILVITQMESLVEKELTSGTQEVYMKGNLKMD